jgi:hypothetical protein
MFRFSKPDALSLLVKPDVLICQIKWFNFSRQNICFSCLIAVNLVICITYYIFIHTFVAPYRCIHIGGALLDFLKNVQMAC